jgi:hypothetical protein
MWFTEAYFINILVKLIFKTFTLENSKKKDPNISPRPGIRSLYLLFWLAHIYPIQSFQSDTYCVIRRLKKINSEEDEKI